MVDRLELPERAHAIVFKDPTMTRSVPYLCVHTIDEHWTTDGECFGPSGFTAHAAALEPELENQLMAAVSDVPDLACQAISFVARSERPSWSLAFPLRKHPLSRESVLGG